MVAPRLSGRTLGDFTVHEKLGEGGYGVVYRAEQRLLGREAVVKVLHARHDADERVVQRFLREAKVASKLDHPYAAHIYAFGAEDDGLLWIAMELVRGTTLSQVLDAQPGRRMPVARLVPLLDRVCEVVHTAHEAGIVHRDLKPDNIMVLARAGRLLPKLLDFGVAKLITEPDASPDASAAGETDVRLTQRGARVGSPMYMAPEQWADGELDARSDLYALGIVAYEALAGRVPFGGNSMAEIGRGHVRGTLPPLPDDVPAELGVVLARATAKKKDDRFTSALELAAALRGASGMSLGADAVPHLDEAVRAEAAWLPQPIAESVAAFEGARNPHQAKEALWQIVAASARWLGVIAIAARSRVGDRGPGGAAVSAALHNLPRRELADEEWLELARALARPFAAVRDAHPVPELVDLVLAEPSPFQPLFALRAAEATTTSEESVRDRLAHALPPLSALLRALGALGGYQIVVKRGARAEIWMGKSRAPRPMMHAAAELADGEPTLADLDGRPVLSLAPLCAIDAPTPGAPDELFVFAGPGRARGRGARLVSEPHGFERHSDEVWTWLRERVLPDDDRAAAPVEDAPYRGLAAFTAKDAAMFFGRERAAEAFQNQLLVTPLCAVVGPSGAGKSSFVQAGVLPALPPSWHAVILRPGAAPMAALTARLDAAGPRLPDDTRVIVVDQFEELFTLCHDADERARFAQALADATRAPDEPTRVVLTVRDDFLARAAELPALRDRLAQGVTLLANPAPDDLLRIVTEPARRAGYDFDDPDLPQRMVRAVAGQPGALALLSFTASRLWDLRDRHFKRLTRKAYDAIGGVEGALAAHAEEVLQASPTDQQALIRDAFRHLVTAEGTRAVLTRGELDDVLHHSPHAEAVVERLVNARLLVAAESETGDERIEVVHEALLSAWPRLVEWRRDDAEGARLRDQLRAAARQWADRDRARGLLWRDDALDDYRRWRARWPGALPELDEQFAAASLKDAARGRRIRRTLAAISAVVLVTGVVALSLLYRSSSRNARDAHDGVIAGYVEQGRRLLLDGDYLRALPYLSAAYSAGDDSLGLRIMLHRALKLADTPTFPEHKAWLAAFRGNDQMIVVDEDRGAVLWDIPHHRALAELPAPPRTADMGLPTAAVADNGSLVAIANDNDVIVWDSVTTHTLAFPNASALALDPEGARLAIADAKTLNVVDLTAGRHSWSASLDGNADDIAWLGDNVLVLYEDQHGALVHDGAPATALGETSRIAPPAANRFVMVTDSGVAIRDRDGTLVRAISVVDAGGAAISPDGKRVAVTSPNGTTTLFDVASGRTEGVLTGTIGPRRPHFSPDGKLLVTSGEDQKILVWDVVHRSLLVELASTGTTAASVAFAPTSARALVAGPAGVRVFPLKDPAALTTFDAGEPATLSVFSDDDATVLTSSISGVELWDGQTGAERSRIKVDLYGGSHLSPDGKFAVIPMASGRAAEIREIASGSLRTRIVASADVVWAIYNHAGTQIVTTGRDGTVDLWSAEGQHIASFRGHSGVVFGAVFSSDDRLLVTAGEHDDTVRTWDVASTHELARASAASGLFTVDVDGDGDQIVAASDDRTALLWDVRGLRLRQSLQHDSSVRAAAISRNGDIVAVGGRDGTLTLWDARAGQPLCRFRYGQYVMSVAFARDASRVVGASIDQRSIIWDISGVVPTPAEVGATVSCDVPFKLLGSSLIATTPPPCAR